jgi:hypothetical protein
MAAQVIERDKLGVLDKIGQGGQGVVYRAPNVKTKFASSMVYKEYKAKTLAGIDFTVLAAMPALVEESLSYTEAERLISIAAWPCRIVENGGTPTGFVMPAIPAEFFIPLRTVKGVSNTTAEFQHLLNHPSVLVARGITIDDVQRFTLLREVASGLAFLHKHGVCVGDISPKNLLFTLTPQEAVYFIDCDAMGINGVSALPQVETPGWETPAREELATIYSDTYKVGLLALRLLTGDQDTNNPAHLPSTTPVLLRQIITDTLTNQPAQRPLPEAWTYVLGHAIEEAQHHKLTAAKEPTPDGAAADPPPIPTVHSRPPIPRSRPPVRPSAPAPRPAGGAARNVNWWIVLGAAAGVIAAIVVTASVVGNDSTTGSTSSSTFTESSDFPTLPTTTTGSMTPRASGPPPGLKPDPDQWGDSCNGFSLPGSPTHAGRGTDGTSCAFAEQVLRAYLSQPSRFNGQTVQIDVESPRTTCPVARDNANPSPPTAILCSGDNFVMTCTPVDASNNWFDCRGGNLAEVYVW